MLTNKTNRKIICKEVKICKNHFCKAKGLMFTSANAVDDKALIFDFASEKKISLHMLFVFYPIDVIFLDKKKKVVETTTLKPFCLAYVPKRKAKYVIECKKGSLIRGKVHVGDFLKF